MSRLKERSYLRLSRENFSGLRSPKRLPHRDMSCATCQWRADEADHGDETREEDGWPCRQAACAFSLRWRWFGDEADVAVNGVMWSSIRLESGRKQCLAKKIEDKVTAVAPSPTLFPPLDLKPPLSSGLHTDVVGLHADAKRYVLVPLCACTKPSSTHERVALLPFFSRVVSFYFFSIFLLCTLVIWNFSSMHYAAGPWKFEMFSSLGAFVLRTGEEL